MICWCTGQVTDKIRTLKIAAFASLAVHLVFGWWALRSSPDAQWRVDQPVPSSQRLLVQLIAPSITLPPDKAPAFEDLSALLTDSSVNMRQTRRASSVLSPRTRPQRQGQDSAGASQSTGGEQVTTQPATVQTPAQAPASLNLDIGQAAKAAGQQRRKSGLSAAVDAIQSGNSHVPETRAFARLAPVDSGIVSETIMVDGTRRIKFSAGGCMRVVNPSSRQHDDIRKSVMENC